MMDELDKDQLERLVEKAYIAYHQWRDCNECQYNQYICSYHTQYLESVFEIFAYNEGLVIENMQVVNDEKD